MKNLYFLFFFLLFFVSFNTVRAQNISNEGPDFWLAFPTHDPNTGGLAEMNVNVTSKLNSEVTVTCGSYTSKQAIPANTVVTFTLPRIDSYIAYTDANKSLTNRAIHVKVTAGMPNVAVYSHVYASARSAASLILPTAALGQKYYSMNYTQDVFNNPSAVGGSPARNFLLMVATEANTKLLIHTKTNVTIPVTLAAIGDVYEYVPNGTEDLTGTFVEVDETTDSKCKKFAAYSGSTSMVLGCGTSRDPLFQQLYTINSWGKTYGVVPFLDRRYILRVLAQEDNTKVNVGSTPVVLNKGQFYEAPVSSQALFVSADKLISVAQYSLTQTCSAVSGGNLPGDPDMVLLNPTEFNINKITLFTSGKNAIDERYINVFMKTSQTGSFTINGAAPSNGTWQTMPTDPTYSYIQMLVTKGLNLGELSFTLAANDGFNAIAYGYGNAESYSYSAGTNLASSQFLVLVNKTTHVESASSCVNQPSDFKVTLPYVITKIIWKLGDGDLDYIDNAPTATTSVVNGETLYTYAAPVNKTFTTTGQKSISALATLSTTQSLCSNTSEIELNFTVQVDPLPVADFDAITVGCSDEVISFTDKSTTNVAGKNVSKWIWDFGDGSAIDNTQNPTHTYTKTGAFTVKLTVNTAEGCSSMVITKDITINPKPKAAFTGKQNTCIATEIAFTDKSTVGIGGTITKWNWDFGDGSSIDHTQNPKHTYATAGNYTTTLTVETDKACISLAATSTTNVTNLPTLVFSVPDVCLSDAQAIFINTSTDYDGTTAGLIYEWDFGDPASGALNKSAQRDGKHKYNAAAIYKVTLKITNANGCTVISSKDDFTVNGSTPIASFIEPDINGVCSNQSFTATNTSTVNFGNITRVEWYIDNVLYTFDEDPTDGKVYSFDYPQFTSPATKTIKLKLVAFSGSITGSCSASIIKDVILKASPVVEFNPLSPMCLNAGTVQFVAKEIGGLPGVGEYSGQGVNAGGLFNPFLARVGVHDITYTFTASNGCINAVTQQVEVYPVPTVNAGEDFYLLSGGSKQLDASATGTGLTFKWTPATGLSRDDVLNPIASPLEDTQYTLTVTSDQGCNQRDQIYVHVLQDVNAPNSFTPNGDGINDVWNVRYLDTYPNGTVEIYDRNGQRVYFSKGYAVPFDGNYKNQPLPVGTYYYIISPNSGRKSITGNLTIIK